MQIEKKINISKFTSETDNRTNLENSFERFLDDFSLHFNVNSKELVKQWELT
jgi:hypothetical protein